MTDGNLWVPTVTVGSLMGADGNDDATVMGGSGGSLGSPCAQSAHWPMITMARCVYAR